MAYLCTIGTFGATWYHNYVATIYSGTPSPSWNRYHLIVMETTRLQLKLRHPAGAVPVLPHVLLDLPLPHSLPTSQSRRPVVHFCNKGKSSACFSYPHRECSVRTQVASPGTLVTSFVPRSILPPHLSNHGDGWPCPQVNLTSPPMSKSGDGLRLRLEVQLFL